MLLGTALGSPGGHKALLSRRFKGDLGNFRKSGKEKNGKNGHRAGDFKQILEAPSTSLSVGKREKLTKSCAAEFRKQKKRKHMRKRSFGDGQVEEAICVGHFLEVLGQILAVHLLGYEGGTAIFCRSPSGAAKWEGWRR